MPAHSKEGKIAEISEKKGMIFHRDRPTYDSDSLENLPDDIKEYWETKLSSSEEEVRQMGDHIIEKYGHILEEDDQIWDKLKKM